MPLHLKTQGRAMKKRLSEFVAKVGGPTAASRALGVSPPAIHKALQSNRNIFVIEREDGSCVAEEVRPFPSQKTAS